MESEEIRYKEFKRSVRGYSPDEVDDLIDSVADELDEARSERDRLSGELGEARTKIERYESLEGSIRATLTQAEKAASDYKESARREAEVTIHEAEAKSRKMLADASSKVERVQGSYEALLETRGRLDAELRRLLEGHLRLLDDADSYIVREIEEPLAQRLDPGAISAAQAAAAEERREGESRAYTHEEVSHIEVRDGDGEAEPEAGNSETGETEADRIHEDASEGETVAGEYPSSNDGESPRGGWFPRRRG